MTTARGRGATPRCRNALRRALPAALLASSFLLGSMASPAVGRGDPRSTHPVSAPVVATDVQVTAHDGKFWEGTDPIELRGVYIPPSGPVTRFAQVGSWGMNLVRLDWQWSKLEPNP